MSGDMGYAPPKYVQIVEALRRRIADGTYPPGSLLPSESQLIREFGVARPTVVRALQTMQLRGEIEREHGRGSFVKAVPDTQQQESRRALAVLDRAEVDGPVKVVTVERCAVPAHVAGSLGLAEGAPVLLRRYVRSVEDPGSELVSLWVPLDVATSAGLDHAEALTVPLRRLIQAGAKLRLAQVTEVLSARHPTKAEADLLGLKSTAPVLGVVGTVRDSNGRAVLVADVALPGKLHDLEDTYSL